jgi:beta-N-acetylhexosaminidase
MQLAPLRPSARPLEQAAADLMSRMSPEERIGQLVLVTLRGSSLGAANPILDLLANHNISGVVLLASNDNFVDTPNTLSQATALISELQRANHQASLPPTPEAGGATQTPERVYVPLLIGISQEGNGPPFSQIRVLAISSAMAIGAWDAGLTVGRRTGARAGGLGHQPGVGTVPGRPARPASDRAR